MSKLQRVNLERNSAPEIPYADRSGVYPKPRHRQEPDGWALDEGAHPDWEMHMEKSESYVAASAVKIVNLAFAAMAAQDLSRAFGIVAGCSILHLFVTNLQSSYRTKAEEALLEKQGQEKGSRWKRRVKNFILEVGPY